MIIIGDSILVPVSSNSLPPYTYEIVGKVMRK